MAKVETVRITEFKITLTQDEVNGLVSLLAYGIDGRTLYKLGLSDLYSDLYGRDDVSLPDMDWNQIGVLARD